MSPFDSYQLFYKVNDVTLAKYEYKENTDTYYFKFTHLGNEVVQEVFTQMGFAFNAFYEC